MKSSRSYVVVLGGDAASVNEVYICLTPSWAFRRISISPPLFRNLSPAQATHTPLLANKRTTQITTWVLCGRSTGVGATVVSISPYSHEYKATDEPRRRRCRCRQARRATRSISLLAGPLQLLPLNEAYPATTINIEQHQD